MKHYYALLLCLGSCWWHSDLLAQCTPAYLFPTLTPTHVSCNGANDGCLTVNPVGARGNVGYQWSTGATTGPTLCGLGQGLYTVTITDTLPATPAGVDTAYFETFDGISGWTLTTSTGTNAANNNFWTISSNEAGNPVGNCGSTGGPDQTLHITSTLNPTGGAAYNAGGLCPLLFCVETNRRAESPVFSTVGLTGLTLTFDYIANGAGLTDNASVYYNDGTGWQILTASIKSTVCVTGQGLWTQYTATLPASCDNNPTVQVGINWTNDDDGVGTDPSVAVNNILVTSTTGGTGQVCSAVVSDSILEPATLVSSFDTIGPVVCTGSANGLADLAVSGGTGAYTYAWSNGATTQDLSGLTDTTYIVTVTDANGCTTVDTAVVPLVGALDVTLDTIFNVACHGDSTGAIWITATGDTVGPSCSSSIVALNEIMYRPIQRNGQDPNTGEYIELIGPPGANIGCYVLTDGDWTITIPPGTTIPGDGYFTIGNDSVWGAGTFDLDAENCNCFTEGAGGQALLILTDGGEYVALFDATGTFVQGVIYGSPSAGNMPNGNIYNTVGTAGCVSSVTLPPVAAFETAIGGLANGTALIRDPDGSGAWVPQVGGSLNGCNVSTIAGGNGTVSYLWSNGDTTQDISSLTAGTYTVTATNTFGCTDTATYVVGQPAAPISTTVTGLDAICLGDSTGTIDLTVTGGTAPYTYLWSTGDTTEDLSNLPVGSYCGIITDANGCVLSLCDTILVADSLDIPVDTLYLCLGDSIQLPLNTSLNSVVWSPASSLSNPLATNPFARPTTTTTYYVQSNPPNGNLVINGDFSQGNVGFTSSYATYGGGIAGGYVIDTNARTYNAQHSGFDHTTGNGNFLIADPPAGNVDVWCQTINVTPNTLYDLSFWANNIVRPTSNFADPTIEATINGSVVVNTGVIPENPDVWINAATQWNSGAATTATICIHAVNASGGGHDFGLDDIFFAPANSQGCTFMDSVVVVVDSLNLSNTTTIDPLCFGDATGSINTNTTGLNYSWNTGDTTAALTNIPAGTYSVTVTGANGCTDSLTLTLNQPDSLYIRLDSVIHIGCFNNDPGSILVTPIGGTGPYRYNWSNGDTTQDISGLLAGQYCLTLTDANGCVADTLCATVLGIDTVFIVPDTVFLCLGDTATLVAMTTGGVARPVQWTPNTGLSSTTAMTTFASPTVTTTYTVSLLTLGRTCPSSDSVVVVVDEAQVSLATTSEPLCNGDSTGSITTSTTVSGLNYRWNTGDTTANLINLAAGTYTLVATGAAGFCTDTLTVTINQPDSLLLGLAAVTDVTCHSGNDGAIATTTVTGGTPTYSYLWNNNATTSSLSNLSAGVYRLTVTDANNCTTSVNYFVDEPVDSISLTYTATPVSCGATSDGSLTIIPINGVPSYTYQWGPGTGNQTTVTATNLATGTYTITVTDSLGCTAVAFGLFVPQSQAIDSNNLSLVILDSTIACDLVPAGVARINQLNNPVYTYLWSNGTTAQQADDLPAGSFSVTVTNSSGCSIEYFGTIGAPFVPTINPYIDLPNVVSYTTQPNTVVNIGAGNDERPLVQYNWTVDPSTAIIDDAMQPFTTVEGLEPGIYALLLTATSTDADACVDTGTVFLVVESEFLGMPTAFTPNGDGTNDLYRPVGLRASDIVRFRIFNRWGQEVYNGDDLPNAGWDGTYQGVPQPTEVYLFLLEYQLSPNSRVEVRKGEFTLMR